MKKYVLIVVFLGLIVNIIVLLPTFSVSAQNYFGSHLREQRNFKSSVSERKYFVPSEPESKEDLSVVGEEGIDIQEKDNNISEDRRRMDQISRAAKLHAERVVSACPEGWEEQSCLSVVSDTYLTASALYAEELDKKGYKSEQDNIKEHCAASTAATRLDDVPAYAMRSAFVECSNEFYDIYERTGVMMDQELSQLMVMAVLCLDKDKRCGLMEAGLKETMIKQASK